MGRHSSVSSIDLNFRDRYQPRYQYNLNVDTRALHSISAFDFNFSTGSMLWGRSSYTKRLSIYTSYQTNDYSSRHMCYWRTDDLPFSTGAGEGTSNIVLKCDNEDADEGGDGG
ncbi:hypothetical protein J1N35_034785 [Gossypium stocksii]|uniref:Uncharacterized protein n=1 Tax=Gossypium stocksii TaxID=47602 RepID=A0A9D3UT75_9ROSI|nr:hypothetical protein J1N35_034785 [Gossypium stocksii]